MPEISYSLTDIKELLSLKHHVSSDEIKLAQGASGICLDFGMSGNDLGDDDPLLEIPIE